MTNKPINGPTDSEETQAREFLSRAEIRTMKKDIQKLREGMALKEVERIIKLKTPEEEKIEKAKLERIKQAEIERQETEKQIQIRTEILENRLKEEKLGMAQLKDFATEEERRKIFYLESEKIDLDKHLQSLQNEKESPLLLKKNKFLLERNAIEERIKPLLEEEKRIENEQKFISENEKTTNVPKDKQNLEKRRWKLEEEREKIEKQRWMIERELEETEKQIKSVDEEYQKVLTEQEILKDKITEINNSLKGVYLEIIRREEERKKLIKEQKDIETLRRAEIESKRKEEIRRQEWSKKDSPEAPVATPSRIPEEIGKKPFIKGVPDGRKKENLIKKIQEASAKEEEERKKFLEDVEKWAEEENKEK